MVPTRVTGRHWLQAVAVRGCLIGILVLSACYPSKGNSDLKNENVTVEPQDTRPRHTGQKGTPALILRVERTDKAPQDSESTYYDREDLVAQRSMADSTSDLVTLTERQVWFVAFESILLIATIYWAARASRHASRAAVAAEQTIAVTQQNARDQLRAYVSFVPRGLTHKGKNLYVAVDLVNSGSTPAGNVRVSGVLTNAVYPIPDVGHVPEPIVRRGASTLAPGIESRIYFKHQSDQTAADVRKFRSSNSPRYTFAGRVDYTDIYGADRWSEVCWNHRYGEDDYDAMIEGVRQTGLEYAPHGNESDNIHQREAEQAAAASVAARGLLRRLAGAMKSGLVVSRPS